MKGFGKELCPQIIFTFTAVTNQWKVLGNNNAHKSLLLSLRLRIINERCLETIMPINYCHRHCGYLWSMKVFFKHLCPQINVTITNFTIHQWKVLGNNYAHISLPPSLGLLFISERFLESIMTTNEEWFYKFEETTETITDEIISLINVLNLDIHN